ncbi:MAG: carboxypeptidase regulatory-like domain-containing protein [Bryobacteraceae bacterium]|nr:carboxypeptidase regulatory-like domain-containing protein [Bryobacteraceae bacterium]
MIRPVVFVLLATVGVPLACFAQSDRGTITGTVLDPASAVVPGAQVAAVNRENGSIFQTVTTPTGNYTLPSLPAGLYDLSVELSGFKRVSQQAVQVQVAQTARLDFVLQVGTTTDTVTVTAEAQMLRTENAEQSINVSGNRINALPLNFGGGGGSTGTIRSWTSFIVLSPGVSGTGQGARVNGIPPNNFKIIVEGQDVTSGNDTGWTSTVTQASVEMIQEFSLQTSNFAAEFGQVGGGLFNFTTRSGTNQFHGSVYDYMQNEALDAYRPVPNRARPRSRKHNFGGTLGGPIAIPKLYDGRNRTFFFFNYEMFRTNVTTAGNLQTLPSDAYRTGDFSAALTGRQLGTDPLGRPILENTIYDPQTSRAVNGVVVRDPFPGNIIPSARLDPVAVKIQDLIPRADRPGLVQNWAQNAPNYKIQAIPAIKLDHNLNSGARASLYWSKQRTDQWTGPDALPFPITGRRDQLIYSYTTRVNYNHSLTPTVLLNLGAGYVRFHNPDSAAPEVLEYDAVGQLGFRGSATNPAGFPRITGLGSAQGGVGTVASNFNLGPSNANKYFNDKWTSVASASYVRGNHTYKLGGEFRIDIWTDRNSRGAQGILDFNAAQTGLPSTQGQNLQGGNVGFPYASFLLGLVNTASVNAVQDPQWRKKTWGLFVQDTWKVSRRFTLDYGLRWDLQSQGKEIHDRSSMFGPTIPNSAAGGRPGGIVYEGFGEGRCDCRFTSTYPYAIGPRIGGAFQIDNKTVLRSGFGITYTNLPTYGYFTNSAILGVGFDQRVWDNPGFGDPAVTLRDGLQYNVGDLYVASLNPGLRPTPGQLNAPSTTIDPNGARPGRIFQWNIGIQREILPSLLIEAAYVGNRGGWLTANNLVSPNALSDQLLGQYGLNRANPADQVLLISRIDSQAAQSRGFRAPYAGYPGSATVAQTLRPFPQFNSNLQPRWAPLGNSWYDSLQAKVTKRYSHGLDLTASFTWQKELTNAGLPNNSVNDVFNRANQKSIAPGSQPLVFVTAFNYLTPRWSGKRLVGSVLGGWTVGGLLRYSSGTPIPVPLATTNLNQLVFQNTLMDRVAGEPLYLKDLNSGAVNPNAEFVLNPKAWANPGPGQWGVSAPYYNDFRNARRPDEQLSLGREFRFTERTRFNIRAEFFNVFNRYFPADPEAGNPLQTQTRNAQGVPTAGFGRINSSNLGATPRNGQLVARFEF